MTCWTKKYFVKYTHKQVDAKWSTRFHCNIAFICYFKKYFSRIYLITISRLGIIICLFYNQRFWLTTQIVSPQKWFFSLIWLQRKDICFSYKFPLNTRNANQRLDWKHCCEHEIFWLGHYFGKTRNIKLSSPDQKCLLVLWKQLTSREL